MQNEVDACICRSYEVSKDFWDDIHQKLKPGSHLLVFSKVDFQDLISIQVRLSGFELRDEIHWFHYQGHNSIFMFRKPVAEKNITSNVLKYGTGGLNIDACRIQTQENLSGGAYAKKGLDRYDGYENWRFKRQGDAGEFKPPVGRWPANIVFMYHPECENLCKDSCPIRQLDEQAGTLKSGTNNTRTKVGSFVEHGGLGKAGDVQVAYGDIGAASRFFFCCESEVELFDWLFDLITPPKGRKLLI